MKLIVKNIGCINVVSMKKAITLLKSLKLNIKIWQCLQFKDFERIVEKINSSHSYHIQTDTLCCNLFIFAFILPTDCQLISPINAVL